MNVQKNSSEIPIISKVGIFSENNAVDIEPIISGNIDSSEEYYRYGTKYGKLLPYQLHLLFQEALLVHFLKMTLQHYQKR